MPNQQGGKNYKKSKHSTGSVGPRLEEAGPDELYGRIIRNLGNLNMNVYCNDNIMRICKVRGSMRKRIWMNIGDLVIVSLRNFENEDSKKHMTEEERKKIERGDIVHKFDASLHSKAKKLDGINPKLFMALENADGKTLGELGTRNDQDFADDNDGIVFDTEGGDSKEEDSSGDEDKPLAAGQKNGKARESKVAAAAKADEDDDNLNIDNI